MPFRSQFFFVLSTGTTLIALQNRPFTRQRITDWINFASIWQEWSSTAARSLSKRTLGSTAESGSNSSKHITRRLAHLSTAFGSVSIIRELYSISIWANFEQQSISGAKQVHFHCALLSDAIVLVQYEYSSVSRATYTYSIMGLHQ